MAQQQPYHPPLWQLTAGQLHLGFAQGRFTPIEALQACMDRCAEVNPRLNALVTLDAEGALAAAAQSTARWQAGQALGPLDGVPITIKDCLQVEGLPTHWGSHALGGAVAAHDEEPVARLRAAGALIFGKTNVPEFTMQGYTDNPKFGPTGNPWQPELTPGGSSGGAVALVAAGAGPIALGTDGGGSIRRPASHTNLVGLKPSRGRVPRADALPALFLDFEVVGPIARCVADVAAMMAVISPGSALPAAPSGARILYIPRFGDQPVDPGIAALADEAAQRFRAMGHEVTTAGRFDLAEALNQRWWVLPHVGLAWLVDHPEVLSPDRPFDPAQFGPAMQANAQSGRDATARDLFDLHYEVLRLRAGLAKLFADYDFILTPATAALPWPAAKSHPTHIDGQEVGGRGHAVFAGFVNAAGLPGIALPCGFVGELPVGLQLVAPEGHDDALMALAGAYEAAHPWQRFPMLN